MASSRWDPIVDHDKHCTNYVYPAAWLRLDYRLWWGEYRLRLMAAVPWSLTVHEYLDRYWFYEALGRALGGEHVGNRRAEKDC